MSKDVTKACVILFGCILLGVFAFGVIVGSLVL